MLKATVRYSGKDPAPYYSRATKAPLLTRRHRATPQSSLIFTTPAWPPTAPNYYSRFSNKTCVTNAEGGIYVGFFVGGAVLEMEACWRSSVVLRGMALNRPVLRWLKTVVVSDRGKGVLDASGGDQEDVPESARPGGFLGGVCAVEASLA